MSEPKAVCPACEDAAKVCDKELLWDPPHDNEADDAYDTAVRHCAAAIRSACRHAVQPGAPEVAPEPACSK